MLHVHVTCTILHGLICLVIVVNVGPTPQVMCGCGGGGGLQLNGSFGKSNTAVTQEQKQTNS